MSSATTRLLVLGVVRILQPVHGYDARRELLSWDAQSWANVAPGSIYNQLKTLARDGLLEVVGTEAHAGRPERTVYSITAEGQKEHLRLLRDAWWKLADTQAATLAAVAFMPFMERDELVAALEQRILALGSAQTSLEFAVSGLPNEATPAHVAEVMRLAAAYRGGEQSWARALLTRLRAGEYALGSEAGEHGSPRPSPSPGL